VNSDSGNGGEGPGDQPGGQPGDQPSSGGPTM
jgi:hypothetical protein